MNRRSFLQFLGLAAPAVALAKVAAPAPPPSAAVYQPETEYRLGDMVMIDGNLTECIHAGTSEYGRYSCFPWPSQSLGSVYFSGGNVRFIIRQTKDKL